MTIILLEMDYWKALRLYGIFNLLFLGFLAGYLFVYLGYGGFFEVFYDSFLFYFDVSYRDFILWFPRYHLPLFAASILLKAVCALGFALSAWLLVNQGITGLRYNRHVTYCHFVKGEGFLLLIALTFYLLLYAGVRWTLAELHYNELQVLVSRGFLLHLLFQIAVVLLIHGRNVYYYLRGFLLTQQLPFNIAILRILFFSYLIFLYFIQYVNVLPTVSLADKVGLPLIGWLVELIPVSPDIYTLFIIVGIASCLFVAVGLKTRFFLLINALCCFYIFATPNFFGKLWHNQIVIWISWFFTMSRCYDVLSLDSMRSKCQVVKSSDYTYPVRLVWLQLGVIYFWAGFYKLWDSGFDWALGQSMLNQVQLEWFQQYDKVPSIRIDQWPLLLHTGGLAVILFELGYLLLVFEPRWRWVAAAGGLVMHSMIYWFMYISFIFKLLAFYVFYLDFNRLFASKSQTFRAVTVKGFSKGSLGTGVFILGMNFLFGMFSVDSYPFSAYPKFSALIPENVKFLRFEAYMPDGKVLNAHAVGKVNGFSWESYGGLEHELIRAFEAGEDVSARVDGYWEIWCSYNSRLAASDSVTVTVVERPVAPEGRDEWVEIGTIATIRTNN